MATLYNPALHEEPRNKVIKVIPLLPRESLLNWLESIGRFRSSEMDELQNQKVAEDLDDFLESEVYAQENEEESID